MKHKLLLFAVLLFSSVISFRCYSVDYYWVGGSGKWSEYQKHWATTSGGTSFHTIVPSSFDNVIFDGNSFSGTSQITLDQTVITCNNLSFDIEGRNVTLIGGSANSAFNIYGNVKLHKNLTSGFQGNFVLRSANAGKTIEQRGAKFSLNTGKFIFDSPTGEWTVLDSLNAYSVTLENGKLLAAGKKIDVDKFTSENSNTRTIDFTNSRFFVKSFNLSGSGLTSSFKGSKLVLEGDMESESPNVEFDTIQTATVSSNYYIYGSFNVKKIICSTVTSYLRISSVATIDEFICKARSLEVSGIVKIKKWDISNLQSLEVYKSVLEIDQVSLSGNDCSNYLTIFGGGQIKKTSGVFNLNYVYLKDTEFIGGAVFNAQNCINWGNNKGINIISGSTANYYWIGGEGNWNDGAHWSLSSGGSPVYCLPTALNDAIFDENSFIKDKEKVVLPNTAICKTLNLKGTKYLPIISGQCTLYGSLLLKTGIDASGLSKVTFSASTVNNKIDFAKTNFKNEIVFKCSGSYIFEDSVQTNRFYFSSGALNTNGKKLICYQSFGPDPFEPGARQLSLGSSTIVVYGSTYDLSPFSPLQFDAGTSRIELYCSTIILGENVKYNIVNVYNKPSLLSAAFSTFESLFIAKKTLFQGEKNTINKLKLSSGQGISFPAKSTHYIDKIEIINPTCQFTEIAGESGKATINKVSGSLNLDHISLKDITGTGGATFNATNSIDLGGNVGWNIQSSNEINFYWIGGSGNWTSSSNWSYSSGGKPANCIPSAQDNVIFDEKSFNNFQQVLTLDGSSVSCKNMIWKNPKYYPSVKGSSITINGSLTLDSSMYFYVDANLYAIVNSGIQTKGVKLRSVLVEAKNELIFEDGLSADGIFFKSGKVNLNKHSLTTRGLQFGSEKPLDININDSKIYVMEQINIIKDSITLSTEGSDIYLFSNDFSYSYFMIDRLDYYSTAKLKFNNIHLAENTSLDIGSTIVIQARDCSFNRIIADSVYDVKLMLFNSQINEFVSESENTEFSGDNFYIKKASLLSYKVKFQNSMKFDYLKLNPGSTVTIANEDTLYINEQLDALGRPGFPIFISSETADQQAHINKKTGTVCLDYLHLKGIKASGGAQFIAGLNSTNISNNFGWDFISNCNIFNVYADKPTCLGGTIKLHSTVPSGQSVSWNGPDNFSSVQNNPVINNAQASKWGFYEMTYSGSRSMVYAGPTSIISKIESNENSILSIINDLSYLYTWYKNNMKLPDETYAITKSGPGTYYLEITNPDGCTERSNSIIIKAFDAPPIKPSNLSATAISSSQIQLNWKDNSNNELGFVIQRLSTETNDFETIDTVFAGTSYTDNFLNAGTNYTYRIYTYNAASYSDNVGPVSATTLLITDIMKQGNNAFSIYPNPTSGNISVSVNENSFIDFVKLYNDKGMVVYSVEILNSHKIQLDLCHMPSGVYLIQIHAEGRAIQEKVIIQ